jgi:hypothetical protein
VTQRDRIVIAVVATVAVLAGYWFLAFKPRRAELAQAKAQVTTQTKQRDAARAEVTAAMNARRSFDEYYKEVVELGKAVPVGDQIPSLIYQLESTAERTRVGVDAIKPADAAAGAAGSTGTAAAGAAAPAAPGGFQRVPFGFEFTGGFFDLERFLATLEKHTTTTADGRVLVRGRLLTIDSVSLALGGSKGLKSTIGATTYALPETEGATAGATPAGPAGATGAAATPPAGTAPSTSTTATVQGVTQ